MSEIGDINLYSSEDINEARVSIGMIFVKSENLEKLEEKLVGNEELKLEEFKEIFS